MRLHVPVYEIIYTIITIIHVYESCVCVRLLKNKLQRERERERERERVRERERDRQRENVKGGWRITEKKKEKRWRRINL